MAGTAYLLIALVSTTGAQAQGWGIDAQTAAPAPGRAVSLSIAEPELPAHGTVIVGLGLSYARWPLVRAAPCDDLAGEPLDAACDKDADRGRTLLVTDLTQFEASVALALFDALQLGLVLPAVVSHVADDLQNPRATSTRGGLSDLRVLLDAPLLAGSTALGAELMLAVPTGDAQHAFGEPGWSVQPALVLRQRIAGAALALQLGYRFRERAPGRLFELEHDDELQVALGMRVPLARAVELRAELRARIGVDVDGDRSDESPGEGELLAALWPDGPFSLLIGGGAGLWSGPTRYGAPALRGTLLARYEFGPASCKDGGLRCEDDADGDGVAGAAELCPLQREDADDFADHDGCPDRDDDGDGLLDGDDQCPRSSEDRDGFEDDDGCIDPDNDDDRSADALDACAMDPEDRDGFEDDDGCPEPGPNAASFSVGGERILVSERIYFEYEQDAIRDVSMPVLDGLAEVITGLRAGTKVVVEGHTDDSGNAAYDLDLSFRRARAVVEYLRGRGVPENRLDFVGRGAAQPLAPGRSPEARALNRRVEFKLVR